MSKTATFQAPFSLRHKSHLLTIMGQTGTWYMESPADGATIPLERIRRIVEAFLSSFSWMIPEKCFLIADQDRFPGELKDPWKPDGASDISEWLAAQTDKGDIWASLELFLNLPVEWRSESAETAQTVIPEGARFYIDYPEDGAYLFGLELEADVFGFLPLFLDSDEVSEQLQPEVEVTPYQEHNTQLLKASLQAFEKAIEQPYAEWHSEELEGITRYGFEGEIRSKGVS